MNMFLAWRVEQNKVAWLCQNKLQVINIDIAALFYNIPRLIIWWYEVILVRSP